MLAEMLAWRPPSGGSRSVGVSLQPAIPQQSPLPLHQSPTIVAQSQCGVWLRSSVALIVSAPNGVSSLLCAPGDISILRRHFSEASAAGSHRFGRLAAKPRLTSSSSTALAIGERTSSGRVIAVRHTPPASRNFGSSIAVPSGSRIARMP
jgi:hypothetical protein